MLAPLLLFHNPNLGAGSGSPSPKPGHNKFGTLGGPLGRDSSCKRGAPSAQTASTHCTDWWEQPQLVPRVPKPSQSPHLPFTHLQIPFQAPALTPEPANPTPAAPEPAAHAQLRFTSRSVLGRPNSRPTPGSTGGRGDLRAPQGSPRHPLNFLSTTEIQHGSRRTQWKDALAEMLPASAAPARARPPVRHRHRQRPRRPNIELYIKLPREGPGLEMGGERESRSTSKRERGSLLC